MSKYIGPKLKLIRRLGNLPYLTNKTQTLRKKTPGEHGQILHKKQIRSVLKDNYKNSLYEFQRFKFNFNLRSKSIKNLSKLLLKSNLKIHKSLTTLIATRLDILLITLHLTSTIGLSRQIIQHNKIFINNKLININHFLCKINDIITLKIPRILTSNNYYKCISPNTIQILQIPIIDKNLFNELTILEFLSK